MLDEVVEACARLAAEPDLRLVVVAAEGCDFSTGVDLGGGGCIAIAWGL